MGKREKMFDDNGLFSETFRSPDIHFISAFVFVMLGVTPLSISKFMLLLTKKIKKHGLKDKWKTSRAWFLY